MSYILEKLEYHLDRLHEVTVGKWIDAAHHSLYDRKDAYERGKNSVKKHDNRLRRIGRKVANWRDPKLRRLRHKRDLLSNNVENVEGQRYDVANNIASLPDAINRDLSATKFRKLIGKNFRQQAW